MAKLEEFEKVERTLFTSGFFSVKNIITLGTKGKDDVRLNPVYVRNYQSNKYSDKATLNDMSIRTGDYIVFSYQNFKDKVFEDIYMSYPHMLNLIQFLKDACKMVSAKDLYSKNGISEKYKDAYVQSHTMIGEKSLILSPTIIQKDQTTAIQGVTIFINSEDKYVDLDLNGLASLTYIVTNFNLSLESSILLATAAIFDIGSVEGTNESNDFGSFNSGTKNKPIRGFNFGNSEKNKPAKRNVKPPVAKTVSGADAVGSIINGEDDGASDLPDDLPDVDEDTAGQGVEESSEDDKPLSLNNILNKAKQIKMPDSSDDEIEEGEVNF